MAPRSPEPVDGHEDAGDVEGSAEPSLERPAPIPSTRRRLLPVLVALGALLAGAPLLGEVTNRREFVIRLEQPAQVTAISVLVLDGDDVLWGTEQRYAEGGAPEQLGRSLPLARGRYTVIVDIVSDGTSRHLERRVTVEDDASEVTVPIR